MNSFALVLAIPLAGAALMPLTYLGGKKLENVFANIVMFLTAGIAISLIPAIGQGEVTIVEWLPGLVTLTAFKDGLSVFLVLIATCIGALIALYSTEYFAEDKDLLRYWAMFTLFVGGMVGLALTSNLLFLYVFWEIVGLTSYALIGYYYSDPKGAKAGLKAFLTTRVGDVGLLIGVLSLYYATNPHTFNFFEIADAVAAGQVNPTALTIAAFGMLLGAVGKSAQVPLHVWLADAMEAPTTISALIHAATMVNAGVYLVARTYPIFNAVPGWADTVLIIGALTAFLTGTMALVEPDFKRVLAFSTVSQLGYMFAGVGAGSVMATQFHMFNHAIFKALLFLCAGMVIHHVGSRNMYEMGGGVGRQMKFTGTCYLIGTLALCGIPILNGFWSKDLIIGAATENGNMLGLILLVLAAILTVAYSFRAYYLVFCGERNGVHVHDPGPAAKIPLGILAVGALTSWLAVGSISGMTEQSGVEMHALSLGELISHTISSVAVVYSLAAIAVGLLIFYLVKDTGKSIEKSSPALYGVLRSGYGFDGFYLAIFHGVRAIGASAFEAFDKYILEAGLNRGVASFFVAAGRVGKAFHPGDVSYNVVGVVTGLLLVIAVMFLAV